MSSNPLEHFTSSLGLHLQANGHSQTSTASYPAENFIAVLSHYGHLAIAGPDAAKFLQGQTSCDVNKISNTQVSPGAYCTPKGRMLSSFLLGQSHPEHYLLRMRRAQVDSTQTALSKYIVFSKAEQHNANDEYLSLGLYGPAAQSNINRVFAGSPDGNYAAINYNGNIAIQIDSAGLMFECWIKQADVATLWPVLSAGLPLSGSSHWELLTIRLGLGEVCTETTDLFIPQMLNYQLIGAISFNKGCYTGQEIVARMEYKGKLKRAMYRIKTATQPLQPGTELFAAANPTGQSIGNIVNSAAADDNTSESLAVLSHQAIDQGIVLIEPDTSAVDVLSLPYNMNMTNSEH